MIPEKGSLGKTTKQASYLNPIPKIALFRYTLILPLLRGEYPPGGKQKTAADKLHPEENRRWSLPDSLLFSPHR